MDTKFAKTALLLFYLLAIGGCEEKTSPAGLAEVRYFVVSEERITLTTNLPGRVSALVISEVRPQVDGIILERLFEEGADVVEGQVLFRIDPAIYQATYNTARATLEEAEANVTALALLEKRYRNLARTNAISQQDLDNAISDHGQARARIARAKAELEAAAINFAYTKIKAPVSGRIGASAVTPGALVTANQPAALAVIQQTSQVYVDITQSSADTIRLRRAMAQGKMKSNVNAAKVRLILEDGSPYTPVAHDLESNMPEWIFGDLLFSEISVGQTTGTVSLRAIFNNPDGVLLPGMYVTAIIEEGSLDNAVLIPQGCVLSGGSGEYFVYILHKEGFGEDLFRVERRVITVVRSLGNRWIVKSGLSFGENIVVEGLQKVAPEKTVKGVLVAQSAVSSITERR
ncbi:MAG: efflux RND transporter periplasmic adaptor subunit [Desulfovibrio sp.]|jgi:membrane fusion protein (multidrug efflux system)|nr:efflux RND transporter periplasmic adaptor subunit [Desulfovibrio sp.]